MVRDLGSYNNMLPNKVMITMHISAYLFVIVVNFSFYFDAYDPENLKPYLTISLIMFMVYFVCILIFGLILNNIVNKVETKTDESASPSQIEDSKVTEAKEANRLSTSSLNDENQKSISSIS